MYLFDFSLCPSSSLLNTSHLPFPPSPSPFHVPSLPSSRSLPSLLPSLPLFQYIEMQLHFLTLLVLLPATCSALQCYHCNLFPNPDYQWSCNYTRGEDTSVFRCKLSDPSNCIVRNVTNYEDCSVWILFQPNSSHPLPSQTSYQYLINIVERDDEYSTPMHCSTKFNESDFIPIIQDPNMFSGLHLPRCICSSNLCNAELEFIILHPSPSPSTTTNMLHVTSTFRDGGPDTVLTTMEPSPHQEPVHIAAYVIPPLLLAIVIVVVCIGAALLCWCNALHRQNTHSRSEFDFPKGGDVMLDLMDQPSAKRPMLSRGQMIQVQDLSLSIVEMVGSGRFGTVWKAVDKKGRAVAVKVFGYKDEPSWRNERYFYRIPSTSHAHVLKYIASGRKGSDLSAQYYMVCHYCQFGSLNNYLENHTVSWNVAMNIIRCIASALAHLHGDQWVNSSGEVVEKSPIAHRDVKSSNILLTSTKGDCVLSDFGLALELSTNLKQLELANSGQVRITHRHMYTCVAIHKLCVVGDC